MVRNLKVINIDILQLQSVFTRPICKLWWVCWLVASSWSYIMRI